MRLRLLIAWLLLGGAAHADPPYAFRDPMNASVQYPMKYGSVRVSTDGQLVVALTSDREPGCADMFQGDAAYFTFNVPAGPGGTFYVGAPFGSLSGGGVRGKAGYGLSTAYVAFELQPFELIPGARLRGHIRTLNAGEGSFEAVVCPEVQRDRLHALPATAPATPVSGSLGGTPFAARTALATASQQGSTRYIMSIELYAEAGVACAGREKHKGGPVVRLSDIGGASDAMNLHGSPQPTGYSFVAADGQSHWPMTPDAWVSLKELRFDAGEKLEGSLVVDTRASVAAANQVKLAGRFEATICPR